MKRTIKKTDLKVMWSQPFYHYSKFLLIKYCCPCKVHMKAEAYSECVVRFTMCFLLLFITIPYLWNASPYCVDFCKTKIPQPFVLFFLASRLLTAFDTSIPAVCALICTAFMWYVFFSVRFVELVRDLQVRQNRHAWVKVQLPDHPNHHKCEQ